MRYIFLTLILIGCAKDPCLMADSQGRLYKVYSDSKVEPTSNASILVYERCNK